ncbi:MAG: hypothetical protein ACI8XB_001617 [Patiriisocius sp.]
MSLFRDCSNPNGTGFDNPINISVYEEGENLALPGRDFTMDLDSIVPTPLGDDCFTPYICLEIGLYSTVVTIDDNSNGYYFTWERCCRNEGINNLAYSGDVGIVFLVTIADPAFENSTPTFSPYPKDGYLCINGDNAIDFNGDSLVYRLETPIKGDLSVLPTVVGNPAPNAGGPKPHTETQWLAPYALNNICGGNPPMSINSQTGMLLTNPAVQWLFAIAIAVDEYRNDLLLGTIRRELQLVSTICNIPTAPQFINFNAVDTTLVVPVIDNTVNIIVSVPNGEIISSAVGEILNEDFESPATIDIIVTGSNSINIQLNWDSIPCDYIGNYFLIQLFAESDNNCLVSTLSNSMDLYLQVVDPDNICLLNGIEEVETQELTIFPNPFHETVSINSPQPISYIQIVNSNGTVISERHFPIFKGNMNFDFKNLSSGLYLIKCFDENGLLSVEKVIKD